jgi:uncharacterized membrane protein YkgB
MGLYNLLVNAYDSVLAVFPPQLQWIITLLMLIGFVGAVVSLLRHNVLALIIIILLLPFLIPVLQHFFTDLYAFFKFLVDQLHLTAPPA